MLMTMEQNITKTYFYFGLLPRIPVGKTSLFLVHMIYVDWQSPPLPSSCNYEQKTSACPGSVPDSDRAVVSRIDINTQTMTRVISGKSEGTLGKHPGFYEIADNEDNKLLELLVAFTFSS